MLTGVVPSGISMPTRLAKILALTAALAALCPSSIGAASDDEATFSETGFGDEISVGYVLVPVVVRGPGGFSDKLEPDDFTLRVDGEVIAIDSFESGSLAPIGILFLQDLSGSMGIGPKLERSRALVECVLRRQRPGDEFAVASFSNQRLFVEVPFPGSEEAIRELLAGWEGYGRTALHDAVAWLPDLVHSRASPRRAVLLVTDGVDNASLIRPAKARDMIRQAEVPVHVIGLETGSPFRLAPDGEKLHRLADTLNLIGWATGGGYHPVESGDDVEGACMAIVESLRHQYVLGFSTATEGPIAKRDIEVALAGRRTNLDIRFRHSYQGTLPTTIVPIR